jgi:sugar lactone lactonase YvrE
MKAALFQPGRVSAALVTALVLLAGFSNVASAQIAKFVGAQTSLFPGLTYPEGITTDSAGSIYVVSGNTVLKETPKPGGVYTTKTVISGLTGPIQVAVDAAGNLYITDQPSRHLYKETLNFNGTYTQSIIPVPMNIPLGVAVEPGGIIYVTGNYQEVVKLAPHLAGYTQTLIGSGLNNPRYVALDSKGNIYVADTQNNRAVKETLSNGVYTQSVIGSGLSYPAGIAVDSAGNVYVSDTVHRRIVKETPSGSGFTQSVIPVNATFEDQNQFGGPEGLALDNKGNLLISDSGLGRVIKWSFQGADFGQVNVGTTSPVISLIFSFSTGGSLYNIATLTQGMVQSDFAYSQTGTCFPGALYFNNVTCSLDVSFTPKLAGDRDGAVLLHNSSLITFATGYLHGIGLGAQMQYFAANQKAVPFSSSANSLPYGVAVDGYGNVFIADLQNNRVLKETTSGPNYVESTVGSGLFNPTEVAVDAGGNVYIADAGNNRVLKVTPSVLGWSQTLVGTGLYGPEGVAVGSDGSVYISDTLHSRVLKETPSGNSYVQITIPTSNLVHPYGIAVDGAGNVYVADPTNSRSSKLTLSNGVYTQSTISTVGGIYGLAVDAMGNVYMALFNNGGVLKCTPSGNTYTNTYAPINALVSPYGVAVDGMGNTYVADIGSRQVMKADFGTPPTLKFASTYVGSTSSDSPKTVMVVNYGNLPMNVSVPATGENPSISPNFTDVNDSFHPCPITDANVGTPGVLAVGQRCVMYVSFKPVAAGNIAGSLVFTDDALNPTHPGTAHQTISLSGVGTQVTTQLSWPTPSAITYGTALSATQLNAVATDGGSNTVAGAFIYSPAAGIVPKPGTQVLGVKFTPTNTAEYTNASKSVNLTVNKAVLTVTATAATKTYGSANPTFAYTITGFVNGDTAANAVTGTPTLTTTAVTGSPAGTYSITPAIGTLAAANYTFKFTSGTLTVNKANLTITANNASIAYNQALPAFTYTPTGFVNGDTAAVLTGTPTETTTAVVGSAPGTYPINIAVGTLAASNYSFTFKNGTLTVTALGTVATPTFTPVAGTYTGAQNITISDTTSGAVTHYTTDGSTPTASSTTYSAAVKITASTTIKAIAVKAGYNNSAVASAAYTIH